MKRLLKLILLIFVFVACGPLAKNESITVDLNNLQPLPTPQDAGVLPLKVAIAAVISPEGTAESYALLIEYLEQQLGRPIEVVQRRTYSEINDLIKTGEVDLAFVCTSAYIVGRREFDLELLVAPIVNRETYYYSKLIVPIESPAISMEDLRGKIFAFTDPMSFSGRIYPTYRLQTIGETPSLFFLRTFFTYSHDDAIQAVADGLADGAGVDSLVLDFAISRDPSLLEKIKIIEISPPFGIPPVVVNPNMRPQLRAQLEEILLNMHNYIEGIEALNSLDIDKFTIVPESIYESAEEIESSIVGELAKP